MPGTRGLPASANARLERFTGEPPFTSFLSVPSAASLSVVGLDPVGDVMGCATALISHEYVGYCAPAPRRGATAQAGRVWTGPTSYQTRLRNLYAHALSRLRAEAAARAADGIVDVRLTCQQHDLVHEVVAVGTAVRARARTRAPRAFVTDLNGSDVARLMLRGWVPVDLHVAVHLGLRHADLLTTAQQSTAPWNRRNVEVAGLSQLVQRAYSGGRTLLRSLVSAAGADGCLLSDLTTSTWERQCSRRTGEDQVALTVARGTSVARFGPGRGAAGHTLSIMPVGRTDE